MDDWCTYTWTDPDPEGMTHACNKKKTWYRHMHTCDCGAALIVEAR